jgi:hypothetical protein
VHKRHGCTGKILGKCPSIICLHAFSGAQVQQLLEGIQAALWSEAASCAVQQQGLHSVCVASSAQLGLGTGAGEVSWRVERERGRERKRERGRERERESERETETERESERE